MPRKLKPLLESDGLTPETFFDLVPSVLEPSARFGTVSATCSVCGKRMTPLPLARPDEPTTKLRVRIWVLRRWLEFPWGGGAFCPLHLPQFHFWHHSFDFSPKQKEVTPF